MDRFAALFLSVVVILPLAPSQAQSVPGPPAMTYEVRGKEVPRYLQVRQFFQVSTALCEAEYGLELVMRQLGVNGEQARESLETAFEQFRDLLDSTQESHQTVAEDGNQRTVSTVRWPQTRTSSRQQAVLLADLYVDLRQGLRRAGFAASVLEDYLETHIQPALSAISDQPFDAANPTMQSAFAFEDRVAERGKEGERP